MGNKTRGNVAGAILAAGLISLGLPQMAAAQNAASRGKMLVTADWLKAHAADKDLVLLYVGNRKDYDAGHIPGAEFVALQTLSATPVEGGLTLELPSPEDLHAKLQALGISDKSRIIVYAGKGETQSATRVIFTLDAAGLGDRTSLLDGGMPEWTRLAYPTSTTEPTVKPGILAPIKLRSETVDAAFVQAHANAPGYKVIDARAATFYDGAQAGSGGVKGHVPGAVSIPFSSVTGADQKLKSPEELAAEFKAAGVKPGDHVITYCHVGQQATAVLFAARSLGIDAELYDGSFEDWARRKLPVDVPAAAPTP